MITHNRTRYPPNMFWLLYSSSMVVLAVAATAYGHIHVRDKVAGMDADGRKRYNTPLYDQMHFWFPDWSKHRRIADNITTGYQVAAMVIWPVRRNLLVFCLGVTYLIRAILFCFTILPRCHLNFEEPRALFSIDESGNCNSWIIALQKFWNGLMRIEHRARLGQGHDLIFRYVPIFAVVSSDYNSVALRLIGVF